MGYVPFRCCPRCAEKAAAVAAALGIAASPMFCNHELGSHHDLPEVAIHDALTEPTVRAITTTGNMSALGISTTVGVGNLTAAGPRGSG